MALDVPQSGWSLCRDHPGNDPKPSHAMRLNLPQNTIDDLIQSLRDNKPARVRFGKHQTLYYGSKSQSFHSSPESHRSEIYSAGPTDSQNIYFSGTLSHRLEVQKAQEATAATDQALANLEQSLNAYEQGKESKRTHMIHDLSEVKGLRTKPSKFPPTNKSQLLKPSSTSSTTNRSVSTTPLAGAITRSPAAGLTPTSAPVTQSKDQRRLDALKLPFIHLLAVRAVSVKFLARQTRASIDDCSALAQKFGVENRINREKFDLKDKTYRELDVWSFPYPSQEDRDEAIENAISAFDRMRISRSDKQWQTLLPKEERGKGKCLSRLDLRTGPIKKTASRVVPEDGSGSKDGYSTGHETDKDLAMEAPSKADAQKKRVGEKDGPAATKRPPVKGKSTTATTTNSTLTGRVTKKAGKPAAAKPDGKIKSAEYVHDSDEDEDMDMPDAPPAPPVEKKAAATATTTATSTEKKKQQQSQAQPKPAAPKQRVVGSNGPGSTHPTPKVDKSERAPAKREPQPSATATKSTTAAKKPPTGSGNNGNGGNGGRATNSTSPQKPSPLGSSPPANASEIAPSHSRSSSQNYASSSSSSPLITQISRPKQRPDASAAAGRVTKTAAARTSNNPVKKEAGNPLKRKAEAERLAVPPPTVTARTGSLELKRRRAVSPSSGGSTGSASPPLSYELLRQQLREKSQKFKHNYAKYRQLHDSLANHPNPPRAELERLHRQHKQLQMIKKEIWDEDRRLREGL